MSWSTVLTLALILVIVSIVAQRGRRSLNQRLGARPRPLFGGFAVVLICLAGFLMFFGVAAPKIEVKHPWNFPTESFLNMQEDLAIHRGAPLEHAQRALAKAQAAIVEREKVKQMIADAATTGLDEATKEPIAATKVESPAVVEAEDSTPPAPPPARPKWLDGPTGLVNGVYYKNVVAGHYATTAECEEALPAELNAAVDQFIDSYLPVGASKLVHLPSGYVHDEIVKAQYEETYDASFGPMKNLHVQLAFDRKVRTDLKRRYHTELAEIRMREVAIGAGSVLLLLGAMFSYLKLDTATRGYYTGRLRLATVLAILGGGAAAFSLVRHL